MRGSGQRDLTQGPIGPTLVAFALPVLGSSALQSLNGSINSIWVGRLIGEAGLTATANANIILFFLMSAVFGVGMASTILVGQAFGRRDPDGAKRVVGTSATFFLGLSVLVGVAGFALARPMLEAMATPLEAIAMAATYLEILFLALPPIYFLTFAMMALRGAGDSTTPFWFMGLTALVDVTLNPLLITGWGPFPEMGIAGSATSLLIGQWVGSLGLLAYVYARRPALRLVGSELGYLVPDRRLLMATIAKGLPMGLQMIVISASGLVMIGIVNSYGVEVTAAYGVAMQLWTYVTMPALAIGAAVSSLASQNVGAGLWERVGQSARSGVLVNIVLTTALILLIRAAEPVLVQLFLPGDPEAAAIVSRINAVGLPGFVPFGVMLVLFAVVRSTGAVNPPLFILAFSLLGVRVPLTFALEPWLGVDAVWWTSVLSMVLAMLLGAAYYRYGRWREARMLADEECVGDAPVTGVGVPVMELPARRGAREAVDAA